MAADFDIQQALDVGLNFLYAWITKLKNAHHLTVFLYNNMVVLPKLETFLELCRSVAKKMPGHQVAFNQQFNGVVKCCPAHPVFVALHPHVQRFNVEMAIDGIHLPQDGVPFRCLPMSVREKIFGKNLLNVVVSFFVGQFHVVRVIVKHQLTG